MAKFAIDKDKNRLYMMDGSTIKDIYITDEECIKIDKWLTDMDLEPFKEWAKERLKFEIELSVTMNKYLFGDYTY